MYDLILIKANILKNKAAFSGSLVNVEYDKCLFYCYFLYYNVIISLYTEYVYTCFYVIWQ